MLVLLLLNLYFYLSNLTSSKYTYRQVIYGFCPFFFVSLFVSIKRKRTMLDNSTIIYPAHYHHDIEIINAPTAINEIASTQYDSQGALFFILIVLLWYAIGVISMLGIQIRARSDTIDDSARRRAKFFLQTLHDQTETKQILGKVLF